MRGNVPDSIPPDDERDAWIQKHATELRAALANPEARTRVMQLLTGESERRKELATELEGRELTMRLGGDDA